MTDQTETEMRELEPEEVEMISGGVTIVDWDGNPVPTKSAPFAK